MSLQERSADHLARSERAELRATMRDALDARRLEEESLERARRAARREQDLADARSVSSNAMSVDHPVRARIREPLSTQESHQQAIMSKESYEKAREARDVLTESGLKRSANREVIDGRGSIDSRAFNERNELVGYSINKDDRPRPAIDDSNPKTKWHSRSAFGANSGLEGRRAMHSFQKNDLGSISDSVSGGKRLSNGGYSMGTPNLVKVVAAIVVVLLVILILILVL